MNTRTFLTIALGVVAGLFFAGAAAAADCCGRPTAMPTIVTPEKPLVGWACNYCNTDRQDVTCYHELRWTAEPPGYQFSTNCRMTQEGYPLRQAARLCLPRSWVPLVTGQPAPAPREVPHLGSFAVGPRFARDWRWMELGRPDVGGYGYYRPF